MLLNLSIRDFVVIALATAVLAIYFYGKWRAGHFRRKGVKHCPTVKPIFGHMFKVLTLRLHLKDLVQKTYNQFPDEKYVGFMQLKTPLIVLRDLELIKQVVVKDFDHFVDRVLALREDADSIFGNHLFALTGDKWKDMRATLSPAFTGSKMRGMFNFITEISEQMANFYVDKMKQPENKERGLVEIEMKDAFSRYSSDVITTTAFGFKSNSFKDEKNEMYETGKLLSNLSGLLFAKFILYASFPDLMKMLRIPVVEERLKNFFRRLVMNTMKDREEKGLVRQDMIHLLQQARKGYLKHDIEKVNEIGFATAEESQIGMKATKRNWSDDDIVAQAILFYIAGFETTSTTLCFMSHELAVNPDIQKRLQDEVDEIINDHGKQIDYNELSKMKYMDMVVSETLRKWPPGVVVDRKCIKPYKLPKTSESDGYTMQVGEGLWIPIYAIHRDPNHFPNPEKFDPERFSDENKVNIKPLSYIPFGVGPRNCIGSRFALMEIKAAMFHLLANFNLVQTAKTQNPLKLSKRAFTLQAEDGYWVGLQPRS